MTRETIRVVVDIEYTDGADTDAAWMATHRAGLPSTIEAALVLAVATTFDDTAGDFAVRSITAHAERIEGEIL